MSMFDFTGDTNTGLLVKVVLCWTHPLNPSAPFHNISISSLPRHLLNTLLFIEMLNIDVFQA